MSVAGPTVGGLESDSNAEYFVLPCGARASDLRLRRTLLYILQSILWHNTILFGLRSQPDADLLNVYE